MLEAALQAARKQIIAEVDRRSKACKHWLEYQKRNRHVYTILVDILKEAKQAGYDRWSIQGALEVARWQRNFKVAEDGQWDVKLPNAYAAYYSRLIMMQEPELLDFMRVTSAPADYEMGWQAFRQVLGLEDSDNSGVEQPGSSSASYTEGARSNRVSATKQARDTADREVSGVA